MINYLSAAGNKLAGILSTVQGWLAALIIFIGSYFAGHRVIVLLVVFVTIMDAFWGILVSLKRKRFALSELARLTISKLAVYGCALAVFVGLDLITGTALTATVVGSAIVLVEFWSSSASMLILFPDFLFLRILGKALTGEIARKLEISEEDVLAAKEASEGHHKEKTDKDITDGK